MDDQSVVVRGYSMPAWLVKKVDETAEQNERTASAEVRVRLAASFGLRTDGTPILAERSSAINAGAEPGEAGTEVRQPDVGTARIGEGRE